jgi:hypothetical protein
VVTKTQFAARAGVTAGRVSQWLTAGQISGDAIVGNGHRARVHVARAVEQLKRNLDVVQHLGANGRARTVGNRRQDARRRCVLRLDRPETPHFSIRC